MPNSCTINDTERITSPNARESHVCCHTIDNHEQVNTACAVVDDMPSDHDHRTRAHGCQLLVHLRQRRRRKSDKRCRL